MKKVEIKSVPTEEDLKGLMSAVGECLEYWEEGQNNLTYDHLENAIAKVLGLPIPNQELEGV